MARITSLGQCRWCGAAVSKTAASRHLAACAGGNYFNESPWGGADSIEEGERMDVAIGEVLGARDRFEYEYDFGSSTWLAGRVLADFPAVFPTRVVHLLARNNPPDNRCARCGNAATRICGQCCCSGPGTFCDACAKEHDCGVEMLLPVVNSPRMGVCAYCGPSKEPSSPGAQ